jgi:hypothetical protein
MSELQNILKEEYTKKDSTIEASELLRMVEEALDTVWEEVVINNGETINEMAATSKKAKEFLLVLPKFVPTEAWGNPDSMDRRQINRLFSVIGGGRSIEGKLKFLARITQEDNKITSPRRIISSLIILESLKAVLQDFNPSSAGFVFEGFLSALFQGEQIGDISPMGNLPIQDLIAFADSDNPVPISLKLLNATTLIEGSYTNLIDGLHEFGKMVYIVARKDMVEDPDTGKKSPKGIAIEQFTFDQNNFIDGITLKGSGKLKGGKHGAGLFTLSAEALGRLGLTPRNLNAEQSIALIKSANSWEEKYQLLQNTEGYSERVRKTRANRPPPEEEAPPEQDPELAAAQQAGGIDLDDQTPLQEAVRGEWKNVKFNNYLTESKKAAPTGTQWAITTAQLGSLKSLLGLSSLGTLPTSEEEIVEIAKLYMDRLNGELMQLFEATKLLSENINKYFTFDKRDRAIGSGERAIENTVTIQKSLTAQIATTSEDPEESP